MQEIFSNSVAIVLAGSAVTVLVMGLVVIKSDRGTRDGLVIMGFTRDQYRANPITKVADFLDALPLRSLSFFNARPVRWVALVAIVAAICIAVLPIDCTAKSMFLAVVAIIASMLSVVFGNHQPMRPAGCTMT